MTTRAQLCYLYTCAYGRVLLLYSEPSGELCEVLIGVGVLDGMLITRGGLLVTCSKIMIFLITFTTVIVRWRRGHFLTFILLGTGSYGRTLLLSVACLSMLKLGAGVVTRPYSGL